MVDGPRQWKRLTYFAQPVLLTKHFGSSSVENFIERNIYYKRVDTHRVLQKRTKRKGMFQLVFQDLLKFITMKEWVAQRDFTNSKCFWYDLCLISYKIEL